MAMGGKAEREQSSNCVRLHPLQMLLLSQWLRNTQFAKHCTVWEKHARRLQTLLSTLRN